MGKKLQKVKNQAHKMAMKLKSAGHRFVKVAFMKDGKVSYRKVGLSTGIVAAAAGGAYAYSRHKKHGHVFRKKK